MARVAAVVRCVLAVGGSEASDSGVDPQAWYQGADGLYDALVVLQEEKTPPPLVVYFYTDWCGYCRQFERELLGTEPIKKYFKDMLIVRINPEKGKREREIADYYGVSGYPSFFVHSNRSKTLSRVDRMKVADGEPVLMSPDEFINAVRTAGQR
jgi:thiol-disulfide isomerase/thioredoxin